MTEVIIPEIRMKSHRQSGQMLLGLEGGLEKSAMLNLLMTNALAQFANSS